MSRSSRDIPSTVVTSAAAERDEVDNGRSSTDFDQWYVLFPDEVLKELRELRQPDLGSNTKLFFKSYPDWEHLTPLQKNNTQTYLSKLSDLVRAEVLRKAQENHDSEANAEKLRISNTTKDDLARLIALRKRPEAQMYWTASMEPMNRETLDARNSTDTPNADGTGSMADSADPYGALAVQFNDYQDFTPQNGLIMYEFRDGNSVPVVPVRVSDSQHTCLFNFCKDLNPTNLTRKHIIRDGAWIKKHWLDLKRLLTAVFSDFDRSGRMSNKDQADAEWLSEEECSRWVFHTQQKSRSFPPVVSYAYYLLSKVEFQTLGKQLEPGVGRDCTLGGDGAARSANGDGGRKRRDRLEATKKKKGRVSDESVHLAAVLRETTAKDHQLAALQFLATQGDAEALAELRNIAFGTITTSAPRTSSAPARHNNMQRYEHDDSADSDSEEDEEQE